MRGLRGTNAGRALAAVALVAVAAAGLAACAGDEQVGTPSHRVSVWVDGAGAGPAIGTVGVDVQNVDKAVDGHQDSGTLKTLCALLANDARVGDGNLPTPDQRLTNLLDEAYQTEYAAGNDCYSGAGGDAKLLAQSAKERAKGMDLLASAVDRITAVTGKVPSTTTTTSPDAGGDPFGGD